MKFSSKFLFLAILLVLPNLLLAGQTRACSSISILDEFAQSTDKVMILAHRGGSLECVENTIEAFQHAVDSGSHILEMDILLTKDGKVVVVHDQNLLRLTGVDKNVKDLNYKDLPPITLPTADLACCERSNFRKGFKLFRIPTLEQILQTFRDVVLHIELKDGSPRLVKEIARLLGSISVKTQSSGVMKIKLYVINSYSITPTSEESSQLNRCWLSLSVFLQELSEQRH